MRHTLRCLPLIAVVMWMAGCSSTVPLNPKTAPASPTAATGALAAWGPYAGAAGRTYARITPTEYLVREWKWVQQGVSLAERSVRCSKSKCEQQDLLVRHNATAQRLEFVLAPNSVVRTAKMEPDGSLAESGGLLSFGTTRVRFEAGYKVISFDEVRLWPITPLELARAARDFSPQALSSVPGGAELMQEQARLRKQATERPSVTRTRP